MAQGYAFGRPAPLPSTAELLIDELTDVPGEGMTEQTPEELMAALPEITPAAGPETADLTGELDGLTDDVDGETHPAVEEPTPQAAVPPLPLFPWVPVQRSSGPTGEFPRPEFPEDEAPAEE
jgi:hypothetical protein